MLLGTALLALAPGVLAGMYGKPVINLDAKTFKQALSVEHAAMVAFVAPWCGHCKALGPEYTAAAASLSPLLPFYAVDCDEAPNKALCAEYDVKGFPTIKAFPRALKGKGAAKDYHGDRKTDALVEYAKSLVPDRVKKLRVAKEADSKAKDGAEGVVEGWLKEKKDMGHVLLVHPTQPSIPFLWKVLGHRLASKVSVGYVRDTPDHSIISSLGIYDPADSSRDPIRAVFWPKGAKRSQLVEYDGAFKFNALLEWITAQLDSATMPSERDLPIGSSAPKPKSTPSANVKADATKQSTGETDAERRARLKAKMEEAERRDQARRDKLAQAQRAREAASADEESTSAQGDEVEVETETATPVDAPAPQAEEGVEEEMLDGQSEAEGLMGEAEPEPEEAPEEAEGAAGVQETRVHEEL